MRAIKTILIAAFIPFVLGACARRTDSGGGKAPAPPKKSKTKSASTTLKEYFPEFQVESLGLELKFRAHYSSKTAKQDFKTRIKLQSIVKLGEHDYVEYVIENTGLPNSSVKTLYYRTDDSGVWKREHRDGEDLFEMPFPVKMNEGWSSNSATAKNYGVAKAFEDIEVAGTTYKNCLRIEYQITLIKGRLASQATQIEHRAPGIGMIKSVIDYQSGDQFSLELTSVKKPGSP